MIKSVCYPIKQDLFKIFAVGIVSPQVPACEQLKDK